MDEVIEGLLVSCRERVAELDKLERMFGELIFWRKANEIDYSEILIELDEVREEMDSIQAEMKRLQEGI